MKINNLLKLIFSISIIVYIYINLDKLDLVFAVTNVSVKTIILVIISFSAVKIFSGLRYTVILSSIKKVKFFEVLEIEIIASIMSFTLLPGASSELSRFYLIKKKYNLRNDESVLSILYDRATGLAGNFTVTILGLLFYFIHNSIIEKLSFFLIFILLITFSITTMFTFLKFKNILLNIRIVKIKNILSGLMEVGAKIEKNKSTIIISYFCSISMQLSNIFATYLLSIAIGNEIPFYYIMLILPTIGIIVALPISFAGLGLRELSFVKALDFISVTKEISFVLGMYYGITIFLNSLLLYVCYSLIVHINRLKEKIFNS